jgi:hypothetical protein
MKAMAVWDRLLRGIPYVGILRREVVPDDEDDKDAAKERPRQGNVGQHICLLRKNL